MRRWSCCWGRTCHWLPIYSHNQMKWRLDYCRALFINISGVRAYTRWCEISCNICALWYREMVTSVIDIAILLNRLDHYPKPGGIEVLNLIQICEVHSAQVLVCNVCISNWIGCRMCDMWCYVADIGVLVHGCNHHKVCLWFITFWTC